MDWDQLRKRLEMLVFLSHLFRDWPAELSLKHILENWSFCWFLINPLRLICNKSLDTLIILNLIDIDK